MIKPKLNIDKCFLYKTITIHTIIESSLCYYERKFFIPNAKCYILIQYYYVHYHIFNQLFIRSTIRRNKEC